MATRRLTIRGESVIIDTSRYYGYMSAHLDTIIRLYTEDWTPKDIADELYDVSPTMIRYILKRIGFPIGEKPQTVSGGLLRERLINECDQYLNLNTLEVITIKRVNKGRPLDMGGPRDVWIEDELWNPTK